MPLDREKGSLPHIGCDLAVSAGFVGFSGGRGWRGLGVTGTPSLIRASFGQRGRRVDSEFLRANLYDGPFRPRMRTSCQMNKTFEMGRDEIAKLCKYFATNRDNFLAAGVKEAHVRQNLIDPLFEALGWDVANRAMVAPQYRDVIPEDSLDVEGSLKAPDYTFRVGPLPKFYAEAKKCGVNIRSDAAPAYQLRRYGWSAKVAVSILTNFEELAVFDCTKRPRESDKASHARILFFTYLEYHDRWRELWDVFSREAVWSGAFDQYVASKRKRGTSEVDVEFLKEIERWREILARNMALRNSDLSSDDLSAAVQLTIDRIVFLRMAEDRGLEPYEQLLKLCDRSDIYQQFMRELCRKADEKYNSGLFHFQKESGVSESPDRLTPRLKVDDKVFTSILQSLYFAHGSPYHFGVMPVEILGTVYERFLGKVIRLTAGHQAKIEEKPEVRKAGGVYYTPAYIVDYIVRHTVARQIEGRSPAQLAHGKNKQPFRVLDMACGSGSFLLGAYQCLLDHCLKWYIDHTPRKHKRAVYEDPRDKQWRLTIEEKKRILTTHIFGVDIDPQAVEVTKLSLLLKALEGENDATLALQLRLFHDRALPNLADNIKCGNSLIGPEYFSGRLEIDPDESRCINPFDWREWFPDAMDAGGFDCVIGNPPYIRMEAFKELKAFLKSRFSCHDERSDMYAYFVERGHAMLKVGGRFGMIVSNKFLRANYGVPLREFLAANSTIERVVDFAGLPVFQGAMVRTIVLLTKKPRTDCYETRYNPPLLPNVFQAVAGGSISVERAIRDTTYSVESKSLGANVWSFTSGATDRLIRRLQAACVPLKKYCDGQICRGVVSGLTAAFVIDADTRARILKRNPKASKIIKPFLNGRDVRRYRINDKQQYLIYTYHGVPIRDYPAIEQHLRSFKSALEKRATKQAWYELQQPQLNFAHFMESAKIIFPDMAISPRFAFDQSGYYGTNTTYFIPRGDLFLLGLLNSCLGYFYFAATCAGLEGKNERYLRFFGQYLENFPVPPLDMTVATSKAAHDRLVQLVASMTRMNNQLASAKTTAHKRSIHAQMGVADAEIDRLVYDLYGLTADEISLVEASTHTHGTPPD
jgi:hypothetical protein